jgi:hypothetical protein
MAAFAATSWRIQATFIPGGGTQGQLNGVSCTSSTACTGVGSFTNSARKNVSLAEAWNGTKWAIQPTPNPTGAIDAFLNGVSCTSKTSCIAVGYYDNAAGDDNTLAEAWNGTKWAIQPTPNPVGAAGAIRLAGVSCTSKSACTAVGYYAGTSMFATLAEAWNGTKWVIQHTPNSTGASLNEFRSVSCTSKAACTAVGYSLRSDDTDATLAERWNGTKWVIQPTPNPVGATNTVLSGVSCTSSTACTAVGDYAGTSEFLTLAEAWNGTAWVIQHTPNPPGATLGSLLTNISCSSPAACTAGGYDAAVSPPGETSLAEAWNGTKWMVQQTPNPAGAEQTQLTGVSCNSVMTCHAVGYANVGSITVPVAEAHS